jgi:hypothetical protein
MKRLAATAATLLLAACGSATHTAASPVAITHSGPAQPTVTQPVGRTPAPRAVPETFIDAYGAPRELIDNDGKFLVGIDIWPGRYRSPGGTMCHWARLRSLDPTDMIDSNASGDPQVVTLDATDSAFLTQDCGTWEMIPVF